MAVTYDALLDGENRHPIFDVDILRDCARQLANDGTAFLRLTAAAARELPAACRNPRTALIVALLGSGMFLTLATHGDFHLRRPARLLPETAAGAVWQVDPETGKGFTADDLTDADAAEMVEALRLRLARAASNGVQHG